MKKNKQEQYKKLVRKYFWQQKFKESCIGIVYIVFFIFIPFYIGKLLTILIDGAEFYSFDSWGYPLTWLLGVCFIVLIIIVLILLFRTISSWIKDNLRKAKDRAKKELNVK